MVLMSHWARKIFYLNEEEDYSSRLPAGDA